MDKRWRRNVEDIENRRIRDGQEMDNRCREDGEVASWKQESGHRSFWVEYRNIIHIKTTGFICPRDVPTNNGVRKIL